MPSPETPAQATSPSEPKATEAEILGAWTAKNRDGSVFELSLINTGEFTWSYRKGGHNQEIRGVFAVNDGVLAMEPDSGGVMLAEVSQPNNGSFIFQQIGDSSNSTVFRKN